MFGIGPKEILIVVLGAIAAVALVKLAFRVEDRFIAIRRELIALSGVLSKHGLPHLAKITESLAVGDIAQTCKEVEWLLRQMQDPKMAASLLDQVFTTQLGDQLADAGQRAVLLKKIADFAAANPTLVKAAGLAITAL